MYQQLGQDYLDKYKITLCPRTVCTCWSRTHAHVKERKICKIDLPKSRVALFDFLHEVGHIVAEKANYTSNVPRALAEYNATQWGITEMQRSNISVPRKQVKSYNRYVKNKLARGLRRGLRKVPAEIRHLKPKYW